MGVASRREREKEQRREDILEAARRVFQRKGYEATTMGEVAAESELSKGTLYLYFDSKFDLFAELSNQVLSKVAEGFEGIAREEVEGRKMIGRMLRLWAEVASLNIRQFRLAISWIASDERPDAQSQSVGACNHRNTVGMIIGHLAAAIVRGKEDGSVSRPGDAATMACQLWSGMMGALLFSSRSEDLADEFPVDLQTEGFMDAFVELLIAGLGAAP